MGDLLEWRSDGWPLGTAPEHRGERHPEVLTGRLQVIHSVIEPGGGTGDEPYAHDSDEECVIVLEGTLDLWIGDAFYRLEEGDAITHSSRIPHHNQNNGDRTARVLFVVTPPSY